MNLCKLIPVYMATCLIGGVVVGLATSTPMSTATAIGLGAAVLPFLLLGVAYFLITTFSSDERKDGEGKEAGDK